MQQQVVEVCSNRWSSWAAAGVRYSNGRPTWFEDTTADVLYWVRGSPGQVFPLDSVQWVGLCFLRTGTLPAPAPGTRGSSRCSRRWRGWDCGTRQCQQAWAGVSTADKLKLILGLTWSDLPTGYYPVGGACVKSWDSPSTWTAETRDSGTLQR